MSRSSPTRSVAVTNELANSAVYFAEVDRLEVAAEAAGLEAGEIEQAVDQPQQSFAVALDELERGPAARRPAARPSASASSVGPSSRVSGVRNSWLMLVKNVVFASSSSASRSARSRSCS